MEWNPATEVAAEAAWLQNVWPELFPMGVSWADLLPFETDG
jgi:hypothetical protein